MVHGTVHVHVHVVGRSFASTDMQRHAAGLCIGHFPDLSSAVAVGVRVFAKSVMYVHVHSFGNNIHMQQGSCKIIAGVEARLGARSSFSF